MLANTEIGKTLKPVGNSGEIKVDIAELYQELAADLKVVLLEIEGDKVPFFVERARELDRLIYKFAEVDTPESARKIGLCRLFALDRDIPADLKLEVDPWSYLKGWIITDPGQSFQIMIENIESFPQQQMAVGHYQDKRVMIPLVESFIHEVNEEEKILVMDLPEGILDL